MKFLDFQRQFESYPVISTDEIAGSFPGYDRNSLTRWKEKGYIYKIRNGLYRLQRPISDQNELFLIAGKIYAPSCISLESALSWYEMIPDGVFSITSVGNLKTIHFDTPIGRFEYRHLKKQLLFGVQLVPSGMFHFKIANPVKALLDFLYLRSDIYEPGHLEELRLNLPLVKSYFSAYPLTLYLEQFDSAVLSKKVTLLQKMLP